MKAVKIYFFDITARRSLYFGLYKENESWVVRARESNTAREIKRTGIVSKYRGFEFEDEKNGKAVFVFFDQYV